MRTTTRFNLSISAPSRLGRERTTLNNIIREDHSSPWRNSELALTKSCLTDLEHAKPLEESTKNNIATKRIENSCLVFISFTSLSVLEHFGLQAATESCAVEHSLQFFLGYAQAIALSDCDAIVATAKLSSKESISKPLQAIVPPMRVSALTIASFSSSPHSEALATM